MYMTEGRVNQLIDQKINLEYAAEILIANDLMLQLKKGIESEIIRLFCLHQGEALTRIINARFDTAAMACINKRVDDAYVGVEANIAKKVKAVGDDLKAKVKAAEAKEYDCAQSHISSFIASVLASPVLIEKIVAQINKNQIRKAV